MRIGILAVQGGFKEHASILMCLNIPYLYVTQPEHLSGIQGLILPGGESTTMLNFLMEGDFFNAIKKFAMADRFLFGTCAGAILLAKEIKNSSQSSLDLLDVTIERNAYGRQLASHIGTGTYHPRTGESETMEMAFIRAPKISRLGNGIEIFATYQGNPVGIKNNCCMMTTFHPELTSNTRIHQLFINMIKLGAVDS